ncbi:hypothetical protein [Fuerstiella marisgermanici]|uniref:Uncharacterized protein n=1 Tax=Fuerstiella marisgermanici TaxID=1891926 RepID=A0A1P8WKL1_9PLAN|nr:hypothetical protein [Fuerstiella marisgermanici]APZ94612.1 hypothetical protein Fuma_04245 [Fuerstiella marisgermanici]
MTDVHEGGSGTKARVLAPLTVEERESFFERLENVLSATETGTRNSAVVEAVRKIWRDRRWADWINAQPRSRLGCTEVEGVELECIARYLTWLAKGKRGNAEPRRGLNGSSLFVGIDMPKIESVDHCRELLKRHVGKLRELCQATELPNANSAEIPRMDSQRLKNFYRDHLLLKWRIDEKLKPKAICDKWNTLQNPETALNTNALFPALKKAKVEQATGIVPGTTVRLIRKGTEETKKLVTLAEFEANLEAERKQRNSPRKH